MSRNEQARNVEALAQLERRIDAVVRPGQYDIHQYKVGPFPYRDGDGVIGGIGNSYDHVTALFQEVSHVERNENLVFDDQNTKAASAL